MKKNISWFGLIAVMAVSLISPAFAYEKTLPVGSRARLASEALRQVKRIYGWVYVNGDLQPVGGGVNSYNLPYNAVIPRASEISNIAAKQELSFRVLNPTNDWVSHSMVCRSSEGHELFNGGTGFRLKWTEKAGGAWIVPEDARSFEPYLAYRIPIKVKGATSARIISRSMEGHVQRTLYLETEYNEATDIGTIMMLSPYAGERGEIILTYRNPVSGDWYGKEVVYSLQGEGSQINPVDGKISQRPSFHDIVQLHAPYAYMFEIPSYDGYGEVPLGELEVPEDMWVYFHASTTEGEAANGVSLLRLGEEGVEWGDLVPIPSGEGPLYVPIYLTKGNYHVDYGFLKFRPYPQNSDGGGGGGKGIIAVPVSDP